MLSPPSRYLWVPLMRLYCCTATRHMLTHNYYVPWLRTACAGACHGLSSHRPYGPFLAHNNLRVLTAQAEISVHHRLMPLTYASTDIRYHTGIPRMQPNIPAWASVGRRFNRNRVHRSAAEVCPGTRLNTMMASDRTPIIGRDS